MTQQIKVTPAELDDWFGRANTTLVELSLKAFQAVLMRRFPETKNRVYYEFTPNIRQHLLLRRQRAAAAHEMVKGASLPLPFMTIGVQDVTFNRDRMNIGAMKRSGLIRPDLDGQGTPPDDPSQVKDTGGGWLLELKVFPVTINMVVTYIDSDVHRILRVGTELPFLTMLGSLSFSVEFDNYQFDAAIDTDNPQLIAPGPKEWVALDNDDNSGLQSFEFPVKMDTYAAILRKTPSLRQISSKLLDENTNKEF